jgi:tripartite-type tricarboxylate transporter receptor subunit TctC
MSSVTVASKWLSLVALAVTLIVAHPAVGAGAEAIKFPTKPITLICGSAPGAPIDIMDRELSRAGEKHFGQPLPVVNKPGGTNTVAESYILSQPADGYNVMSEGTQITAVLQMPGAPFKYTDFEYVIRVQIEPGALVVTKESQFNNLKDFLDFARKNPGKLKVGGYGTFSFHHFTTLLFEKKAGIKVTWVAYDSGKDALVSCMGGHIHAVLSNPSVIAGSATKVKVLGITRDRPLSCFGLPMPTFKEQGVDLSKYHWRGMIVKKGTPKEIVKILHDGFKKAMDEPSFKDYTQKSCLLEGYLSTGDYNKSLHDQAKQDLELLKEAGAVK